MEKKHNDCFEDTSVVRRIVFASRSLPSYWQTVSFWHLGKPAAVYSLRAEKTCNKDSFASDIELELQLIDVPKPGPKGITVPLLSLIESCMLCGQVLYIRSDRGVKAVIYDDTVPAIHYSHYCRSKGCSTTAITTVVVTAMSRFIIMTAASYLTLCLLVKQVFQCLL